MRERIARGICLFTLCVVAGLSYLFALRHNPVDEAGPETAGRLAAPGPRSAEKSGDAPAAPSAPPSSAAPPAQPAPETLALGRAVYGRNGCATCHAIAGEGNPRYPLDGTGDRWEPDELRAWVTGDGFAADLLPDAIRRRKQRYGSLPEADLGALVTYLSTLKAIK